MAVKENKKIAKAEQEWEYLKGDEAVKRMAFLREKWERDWISNIEGAKEAGFGVGMNKGRRKGKIEEQERIALEMLKQGLKDEMIIKITKIKKEKLEKNITYIFNNNYIRSMFRRIFTIWSIFWI